MMFIVLAYKHDAAARALVQRWRAVGEEAALLICADLSRPGWRHLSGTRGSGRANVAADVIATQAIRAVITRMPAVGVSELEHLHEDDRRYAAAEIQAFLLAWLSSLDCPVLNRPSPTNLAGPWWSAAQWVQRARRIGLAARPFTQRAVFVPDAPSESECRVARDSIFVDVVGDRAFLLGGREPRASEAPFARAAVALSRDAGVDLLRVYFEHDAEQPPVFLQVGYWIDVAAASVADALATRCRELAHAPAEPRAGRRAAEAAATA